MNTEEDDFITYRRRKSRYIEEQEFEDIQLEDTNSDIDPTGIHFDRGKEQEKRKIGWNFVAW